MVPKQKISRGRSRRRRSHHHLNPTNYTECPNCSSPRLPHAACSNCGYVRPGLTVQMQKES